MGKCRNVYFTPGALAARLGSDAAPIGDGDMVESDAPAIGAGDIVEEPVVEGVVVVEGELIGAGDVVAPVSSTFLPQAPRARTAARATPQAATVLNLDVVMSCFLY